MLDAFSLAITNISFFFCRKINKIKLISAHTKNHPMKPVIKKTKKQNFIVVGWFTL